MNQHAALGAGIDPGMALTLQLSIFDEIRTHILPIFQVHYPIDWTDVNEFTITVPVFSQLK